MGVDAGTVTQARAGGILKGKYSYQHIQYTAGCWSSQILCFPSHFPSHALKKLEEIVTNFVSAVYSYVYSKNLLLTAGHTVPLPELAQLRLSGEVVDYRLPVEPVNPLSLHIEILLRFQRQAGQNAPHCLLLCIYGMRTSATSSHQSQCRCGD